MSQFDWALLYVAAGLAAWLADIQVDRRWHKINVASFGDLFLCAAFFVALWPLRAAYRAYTLTKSHFSRQRNFWHEF